MRAAGCEVPEWMLQLKKERRKSHDKAGTKSKAAGQKTRKQGPAVLELIELQDDKAVKSSSSAKAGKSARKGEQKVKL